MCVCVGVGEGLRHREDVNKLDKKLKFVFIEYLFIRVFACL